jgi:hypothetical protein
MVGQSKKESKKELKKVESKPVETDPNAPGFGWSRYAEQINGRFAMIGFVALLVLEMFTRQDIFTWLGLR